MRVACTCIAVIVVMSLYVPAIECGPHLSSSPPDYEWDGGWEHLFDCSTNVCHNGGTCLYEVLGFHLCQCPETHIGWECEIPNRCLSDPCRNGGICDTNFFTQEFYCPCRDGWTGETCQTATDATRCTDVNCQNGGICYYYETSTFCVCARGFYGFNCEYSYDEESCDDEHAPCANGGTCYTDSDIYVHLCQCTSEWAGRNCTQPMSAVSLCVNYCENGGSCFIQDRNGPRCRCAPGWQGLHCSEPSIEPINPCATRPVIECGRNGRCVADQFNRVSCICSEGWQGEFCDKIQSRTNTDSSSHFSGFPTGGIIGASVGSLVLFMVVIGAIATIRMTGASFSKRSQPRVQQPPAAAPLPSMIYNPGVHDDFDGFVQAVPYPVSHTPKNMYSPDRYQESNLPRRYTSPPTRNHSQSMTSQSRSPVTRNPAAGMYDYAYEPGPRAQRPSMLAPRGEQGHEYANAMNNAAYEASPMAPPIVGRPPVYYGAPSVVQSKAPSRGGSRMSEHTYQSISEYGEKPNSPVANGKPTHAPSVKSVSSRHSSRK